MEVFAVAVEEIAEAEEVFVVVAVDVVEVVAVVGDSRHEVAVVDEVVDEVKNCLELV